MAQTSETGYLEDTRSLNLDPSFLLPPSLVTWPPSLVTWLPPPSLVPRDLAGAKSCSWGGSASRVGQAAEPPRVRVTAEP